MPASAFGISAQARARKLVQTFRGVTELPVPRMRGFASLLLRWAACSELAERTHDVVNSGINVSQHEKALRFQQLHEGATPFFIPNPWDAGSARLLAELGFPALA